MKGFAPGLVLKQRQRRLRNGMFNWLGEKINICTEKRDRGHRVHYPRQKTLF